MWHFNLFVKIKRR